MVVIAKSFKTYVSLRKIYCFLRKVPFSLPNLGLPPKKFIILWGIFFIPWGTWLGLALSLFFPKEVTS